MKKIEYQANVYDGESSDWHWEIYTTEDGLLTLKYTEQGRKSTPNDYTTFPVEIALDMAKAIVRVVELSKEK